ncbi:fimbrial biogenesis chaperone [Zavarzinia sp. CC-PAN008]|uniref:fimbrial biogenesis chaperone n=1 Tax=Zavarzinia sp. CC-PAN008 TaxID=3243332 RepID=UPI003F74A350
MGTRRLAWRAAVIAVLGTLAGLGALPAQASMQVSPVIVELPADKPVGKLLVRNLGSQAVNVQVRAFEWRQDMGDDRLDPSTRLHVSPPLFELGPDQQQVVRVVLSGAAAQGEQSFRLFFDELPDPGQGASAIRLPIRFSLPVFVGTGEQAQPELAWSYDRDPDGRLRLIASNAGGRRARIANLALALPDGRALGQVEGLAGYVLAGSSRAWAFDPASGAATGPVRLRFDTDTGAVDQTVHGAAR